ncbi:hypothetical protein IL330_01465 [Acinetobacter baumannii]|uniref:Uncharacterized protein n=1 Tax=Acinetobacter baumannii (strain ATCC 19606 / DSM 30007 / JCM 6841 / CCUG 19606 / CIP 70.34 / NBRC 109757 / NCIMB 12457 / NCTC 12156 / 81) TaxID=575584 RepID=A0ABX6CBY7_ACIB2|nr:hypothetical protein G347_01975 [Acinetobacter baumannii MSP4-16]ENW73083.1 hypothetical protein F911_03363 [Acinetobacter baumannii ATCC 19606 = CIP 70.34 = JCM 6841]MBN3720365.1 hypothetical protein [Acinetobacter baumannii]KFC02284.1 putative membrane protein [Acinetobacter baumannii ATCC 19606 = CIP 70.34 = JCM 6841]QFQ04064.1 hypothetical protein FQU82_00614 [Acinetobacter baumannii]
MRLGGGHAFFWEKLFNHIALYCLVWAVWVIADHKI